MKLFLIFFLFWNPLLGSGRSNPSKRDLKDDIETDQLYEEAVEKIKSRRTVRPANPRKSEDMARPLPPMKPRKGCVLL